MYHSAYIIANYANICVRMYYVELGVEELGVGEWDEVGSGGVESGGVIDAAINQVDFRLASCKVRKVSISFQNFQNFPDFVNFA